MKRLSMIALALLVAGASLSDIQAAKKVKKQKKALTETAAPAVQLSTLSDSTSYCAGVALADIVRSRFLGGLAQELQGTPDSIQLQLAYQGLFDALKGDTTLFQAQKADQFLQARVMAARQAKEEKAKAAGEAFLKENAAKPGVTVMPSGLQYKVITQGTGAIAKESDRVKVNYEGRLIDGTVFDSSYKRGEPATFAPNQVIKGWTEALTMMPVGSKWQLYIPQELGYGARGAGSQIPPYSTLIFDVEVLEIESK